MESRFGPNRTNLPCGESAPLYFSDLLYAGIRDHLTMLLVLFVQFQVTATVRNPVHRIPVCTGCQEWPRISCEWVESYPI
jgi:hypothetical protein